MNKLKQALFILSSCTILVSLAACGKEGDIEGKTFEIVEDSGDILGDVTFNKDNSYRVKDRNPLGGEGEGKYQIYTKDDNDYLIFKSIPKNSGDYLKETVMADLGKRKEFVWVINDKTIRGFDYDGFYLISSDYKKIDKSKIEFTEEDYKLKEIE